MRKGTFHALWMSSAFIIHAPMAGAQAVDAGSDFILEEIIVTANKRAERIQDVPSSVTAVGEQLIGRVMANNLDDVSAYVPGLDVRPSGVDGNRLVFRGLSTGPNDISPTAGVYIDDASFGARSGFALGALFSPDMDPSELARVEVLRGPQGTLYGASTLGGLVKYVTKAPDTHATSGHIKVDYGHDAGADANRHTVRGGINVPLIDGKAALRLSGHYAYREGDLTDARTGRDELNANRRKGGRADLLLLPNDDLTIRIAGTFAINKTPQSGNVLGNAVTLEPLFGDYGTFRNVDSFSKSRYHFIQGNVEYRVSDDLTATSTTGYSKFRVNILSDYTPTFQPAFGPVLGPLMQFYGTTSPSTEKLTQELRLASSGSGPVEWLAGLFYDHEKSDYRSGINSMYQYGTATPPAALQPTVAALANYQTVALASRYVEYAVFGNANYSITPEFDLGAGLRYSYNDQKLTRVASGYLVNIGAATPLALADSNDGVWTQTVDARWRFQPDTMLYGRVARGYRPGGPNTSGGTFDPDTTWNYELGLKSTLLGGRLTTNIAAFYIDWTNIQLNYFNGTNTVIGNAGDARSKGVELETSFTPFYGLTFAGNLTYTDAEITGLLPGAVGGAAIGNTLPYSAKWAGAVRADYYFPLTNRVEANVGGGVRYRSSSTTTFPGDTGSRYYKLPETTFLDLRAGVDLDTRYTLNLQVLNVTDERNLQGASQSLAVPAATADAMGQPATLDFTPGRTFYLSVGAQF